MVVSDVHYKDAHTVERDRFEKAIEIAYRIARNHETYKKLDALFVVGDFADNGSEIQMRAFKDSIDRCVNKDETDVVITLASHEFSQKNGGEEAALERFSKIFNMPYDQHKVINGFHCISLTTTKGCRFDDNKKEFAAKALREAADDDPKKPIFFFQHPHCTDTVLLPAPPLHRHRLRQHLLGRGRFNSYFGKLPAGNQLLRSLPRSD